MLRGSDTEWRARRALAISACSIPGSLPSSLREKGGGDPQDLGDRGPESGGAPTHHFGLEGRLDLPVLQLLPVDPPEEGVFAHVSLALGPAAQPLARVLGHQLEGRREGRMRDLGLQLIGCAVRLKRAEREDSSALSPQKEKAGLREVMDGLA